MSHSRVIITPVLYCAVTKYGPVEPGLHSSVLDTVRSAHNNRVRATQTHGVTIAADTEDFSRENQQARMTGEELRTRNGDVEEEVMIVMLS